MAEVLGTDEALTLMELLVPERFEPTGVAATLREVAQR
jgi:hypothetical protein